MDKYIKVLQGISYNEWIKLREGIDAMFGMKKSELERQLKFADKTDAEMVKKILQSRFG